MNRVTNDRRKKYKAEFPQEQFIVPLLDAHINSALNKHFRAADKMRVLDIGCGRQPFREILEAKGAEYFGLDTHQNSEKNVHFIAEIDKDLPAELKDKKFDFLLCTEVLEHVAEWDRAFLNFSNLCTSGGTMLITCPHFYQLHEVPYDFWRPTPFAIEYFAKKHGFEIVEITKAGNAWDVLGTALANIGGFYHLPGITLKYKIIFRLLNIIKPMIFKILADGELQKNIGTYTALFMSNIAVLQKK
jgi:SAM-dependent methyltransferase